MIHLMQAPATEEWELVRDTETVRSASKEMLAIMREIVEADNLPDLRLAISKAKTLVDKLPIF